MSARRRHGLEHRIRALAPWFHNLELDGIATAPDHALGDYPRSRFARFAHAVPPDLTGKTVLDVGCSAGFYAFEMKRRGAARVVAIDTDARALEQARLAADILDHDIEFRELSVYAVDQLRERFDLVLFMGVLDHLRHPLLALDQLAEHAADDLLLFEGLLRGDPTIAPVDDDHPLDPLDGFDRPGQPRLHFVERSDPGAPAIWWIPNRAGIEAMLRSAGFGIEARLAEDVYRCRRARRGRELGR